MAMSRKPTTSTQRKQWAMKMLQTACASAVATFDRALVERVEMKLNPQVVGQFFFLALLANGERYEGSITQGEKQVTWCTQPHCICLGYAAAQSPIQFGATVEE